MSNHAAWPGKAVRRGRIAVRVRAINAIFLMMGCFAQYDAKNVRGYVIDG